MNLLALLPWRVILPALGMVALVVGVWTHGYTHGTAAVRTKWEAEKAQAVSDARAEESRRAVRLLENVDAAYLKQRAAEADARRARDAVVSLRDQASAYAASSCNSAATPGSPAASAPGDLLSDVLGGLADRAERLAEAADASRIAGQFCEQSYRALTP